jgi:hypothetical protein
MAKKASASASPDENETPAAAAVKVKVEPVANEQLVAILEQYDLKVEQAESFFIEFVEFIQENQLERGIVVASMMKARSITFESAQSQYSRMKKLLNNEEVLQELKDGKITLKVAREKTTTSQANPASAKPEAKEAKYSSTLKAFVNAAKESGLGRREILVGVEAELKAASVE